MIKVCQIYNDFKGAMNTWQKGHFRPQSFEFALHSASIEMFNELKKEWGKSQIVDDHLRPFIKSVLVPMKDIPNGAIIGYPDDYSMYSDLRFFSRKENGKGVLCGDMQILEIKKKGNKCRDLTEEEKVEIKDNEELFQRSFTKVDSQRWGAVCEHEFIAASVENPYCTQNTDGFAALPKSLGWVVLDYLSLPIRPKFAYEKDDRLNFICKPNDCVDLQWNEEILPELMSRLKIKYASFVGSEQKYSEGTKETAITTS